MNKKDITKIILDSLAIIFLAISCILNSISIYKLSNRVSNVENKITESKGVKKRFSNAPNNIIELPGFNQELYLYLNISNNNDLKNFLDYMDNVIPNNEDTLEYLFYGRNTISFDYDGTILNVDAFGAIYGARVNNRLSIAFDLKLTIVENGMEFLREYTVFSKENNTYLINDYSLDDTTLEETLYNGNEMLSNISLISYSIYEDIQVKNYLEGQDYIYGYTPTEETIITSLLNSIKNVSFGFMNIIISLFSTALSIFYVNNELTFLGVVLMFIVAVPLTYWVINFIISIVRKIRVTRGK